MAAGLIDISQLNLPVVDDTWWIEELNIAFLELSTPGIVKM